MRDTQRSKVYRVLFTKPRAPRTLSWGYFRRARYHRLEVVVNEHDFVYGQSEITTYTFIPAQEEAVA